ncbi:hypothetical protein C1645_827805 [Glomus cerebriforme]|uniref:Uncharacterized protein n=1 Tax=Glomus cerebriforme TaxID=658196 RepID=A0A397SX07_9GLOM|nr:hypothetical protein C1645_827805 [Glomus cerebriforme]
MAIKLYEQNDDNLQEFDKDELLLILLKYLLRDVLDPAAEEIQHAKKQWERIYDDDTYFTYSKPPENTPEWAYDAEKIRTKQRTSKCLNTEDESDPAQRFRRNCKKIMKRKGVKREKKADLEEETIDAIFNVEVVYSDS